LEPPEFTEDAWRERQLVLAYLTHVSEELMGEGDARLADFVDDLRLQIARGQHEENP
jgi:hypothetical protein